MRAAGKQSEASVAATRPTGAGRASLRALAARAGLLSLFLLVSFAAPASAVDPPEYLGSFGPDGTEASGFTSVGPVAVDQQTHAVYVLDRGTGSPSTGSLFKFDTDGNPVPFGGSAAYISGNEISGLSPHINVGHTQVAVDSTSHTIYVTDDEGATLRAFQENGEPALFSAGPGVGTNEIGGFTKLAGLAVDINGAIYASDLEADTVTIYAPSGEQITQLSTESPANLAVDDNGALYVNPLKELNLEPQVFKFTPTEFPVSATTTYAPPAGSFSSQASYSVAVDPVTNDVYLGGHLSDPKIAWHDESGTLLATFAGPGEEGSFYSSSGFAFDAASKRLFVARNQSGGPLLVGIFGPEQIFVGPPTIESTFATDVSAGSATLNARINPNTGYTTYRFEYGLGDCAVSACTSVPLDGGVIGSGHELVPVSKNIAGLQPGTTYHYRIVAESSLGTTEGPGRTFTTQAAGVDFRLPDRRAWEMVSPSAKGSARLVGSFKGLIQAADDGNGLAYLSLGSAEPDPDGNRIIEASSVLARRGAGGWRSEDITPPHGVVTPPIVGETREYKFFSGDLSSAVLAQRDDALLSPQASERTPYLRHNTEPPTYTPLVTGKEGFANVPPGTEFGGDPIIEPSGIQFTGATPDLSRVVLQSRVPLIAGAEKEALYEWVSGELRALSVLPDESDDEEGATVEGSLGSGVISLRGAISIDGRRAFWSNFGSATALYLRDTVAQESVRLDVVQPGVSPTGSANPIFQGASADGTVVYFTDSRQLTADASPSGRDLYRCEIPPGTPASGCASLTDISAPLPLSGESAEVQGVISALSDDGTRVYFVAKGVLDTAPNEAGESALAGEPNLYLWQEGEGTRFVAKLSIEDGPAWGQLPGETSGPVRTAALAAAASPNGRHLTFMSQRSLTGYDNLEAESGEPVQEIFRYDAVADRLDCLSCDPSGAAPEAVRMKPIPNTIGSLVDPIKLWSGQSVAAALPQATTATEGAGSLSLHRPRSVFDSGRVFFNAFDSLVPADSNGQWDVYQYEPLGVGDCSPSSVGASTAPSAGGCVSLISSGTAEEEAGFLDASVTGDDAFFLTPARLSVTDVDSELDVYDARVDGVTATLTPSTECLGEACQPAVQAPNDPTPGTAALQGAGNQKPNARKRCPKGKRRVRRAGKVRCVPRKRNAQRQRRAGQGRRASR